MVPEPKKSIEEIVCELGRYPLDAFVFVQECIGAASEHVHGPMGEDEMSIARWMSQNNTDLDELRNLATTGELPPDIKAALQRVGGPEQMNRHVTGQQLCWAVRDTALKHWGLMARGVLARWNITRTEDIGAIIFALVDNGWLQKQSSDAIKDFDNILSFAEAFDQDYRISAD